jgi:hypothetical protein
MISVLLSEVTSKRMVLALVTKADVFEYMPTIPLNVVFSVNVPLTLFSCKKEEFPYTTTPVADTLVKGMIGYAASMLAFAVFPIKRLPIK